VPRHPAVSIWEQAGGGIQRAPFAPPPAPAHLVALTAAMPRRWPRPRRLDGRKETARRGGFPPLFRRPTAWAKRDRAPLHDRLLLALEGRGTGAGRKRVGMGPNGVA
jgi:hypothetical protein